MKLKFWNFKGNQNLGMLKFDRKLRFWNFEGNLFGM